MTSKEQAMHWRGLARLFHAFGFNVVPLGPDKRPVVTGVSRSGAPARFAWNDWETLPQAGRLFDELLSPAWWADVRGVAAVCGPVSGNLVCFDFDDCHEGVVDEFLQRVGLPADYAWCVTTPGGGFHVWLRQAVSVESGKLRRRVAGLPGGAIELRWRGHYTALPGSVHPDGGLYAWRFAAPDAAPVSVDASVVEVYFAMTVEDEKPAASQRRPSSPAGSAATGRAAADVAAYVAKAVKIECQALASAAPGGRNERLNQAAFSLGTLVGAAVLDRFDAENALFDAALVCGLGESEANATIRSGIDAGMQEPRDLSGVAQRQRNHGYIADGDVSVTGEDAQAFLDAGGEAEPFNPWPYAEENGRIVHCVERKDGEIASFPVADFTARNVEEIIDEDGATTVVIEGRARRGGPFRLEVSGKIYGEPRSLRAYLEQAAGARDGVYHKMDGHLTKAIKSLTRNEELRVTRRFRRTGWYSGRFLMPGMVDGSVSIELPNKLPYGVDGNADAETGLAALRHLLTAIDPTCTTPIVAAILQAPLHRLAKWRKRYGVFVQGRTGSLKTSWMQAAMCIYGDGFLDDAALLKWGEGATRNALMKYASYAQDMPFLIDNYKPNTGDGEKGFVPLIHNIVEGGDKERVRRDGSLIASSPVHAFPLCTGEDIPETDAAALSRLFVIQFPWQGGEPNALLASVQRNARHLTAVGRLWLEWLATPEARGAIAQIGDEFDAARARWSALVRSLRGDAANALRLAENLASNELAWGVACQHPQIGAVLRPFTDAHIAGLRQIAARMADSTAEASEAHQFLATVRELLTSKQFVLIARQIGEPADFDAGKVLGWYDDAGIYLLPTTTLNAARRLMGPGAIPISVRALNDQLVRLDALIPGSDRTQKTIKIGGRVVRVLHLKPTALNEAGQNAVAEFGL